MRRYILNIHNLVKIISNYLFLDFKKVNNDNISPDIIIKVNKFNYKKDLSRLDYWYYGKGGEDIVYYEDLDITFKRNWHSMTRWSLCRNRDIVS